MAGTRDDDRAEGDDLDSATAREESRSKSEWMGSRDAAADDPVSDDEKNGLQILGGSNVRDGAIPGVSDDSRQGSIAPRKRDDGEGGGDA